MYENFLDFLSLQRVKPCTGKVLQNNFQSWLLCMFFFFRIMVSLLRTFKHALRFFKIWGKKKRHWSRQIFQTIFFFLFPLLSPFFPSMSPSFLINYHYKYLGMHIHGIVCLRGHIIPHICRTIYVITFP